MADQEPRRLSRWIVALALSLGMLSAAPSPSRAGLLADLQSGGSIGLCGICLPPGLTFGWAFRVNTAVTVDGLGLWDRVVDQGVGGGVGIGMPVPVGLWTQTGTLLASVTITEASQTVISPHPDGDWLFEAIVPLPLNPGDYLIGAVFSTGLPTNQAGAIFVTDPAITILGGTGPADFTGGLTAPTEFIFDNPVFGPTLHALDETGGTSIPEPFGALLFGTGVVGAAIVRGTRRRTLRV